MDQMVWAMGLTRAIYAVINMVAALLIWKMADSAAAIKINAILGSFMGPLVFLLVSGLGMVSLSKALPPLKIAILLAGVALIMYGARS